MSEMTKYIRTLADYNVWANRKITDFVMQAGPDSAEMVLTSSFPTIRLTLIHIWDAQFIWLERMNNRSPENWPGKEFNGDLDELIDGLAQSSDEIESYCTNLKDDELASLISYSNTKGEHFQNSRLEILAHLFNHGTYHRGQLVTMLRNTGFTNLGQTDMIEYFRTRNTNT